MTRPQQTRAQAPAATATAAPLIVNGAELVPDPAGALIWPARRLLVVADLHLEKGSSFAPRGRFLPPYDSRATLAALARLIEAHRPDHVICLGDSFHDAEAAARLSNEETATIRRLTAARRWTWIAGHFRRSFTAHLLGRERIHAMPRRRLVPWGRG